MEKNKEVNTTKETKELTNTETEKILGGQSRADSSALHHIPFKVRIVQGMFSGKTGTVVKISGMIAGALYHVVFDDGTKGPAGESEVEILEMEVEYID